MKYLSLFLLLITLSCNKQQNNIDQINNVDLAYNTQQTNTQNTRKKELEYIKRRDVDLTYFENKEISDLRDNEMRDSLVALENILKDILIDTRLKDLKTTGKINLQTFYQEIGFGMLDGLITLKESTGIIVTSKYLFNDFFPGYQFDSLTPDEIENSMGYAFASNHVITNITSFKIDNEQGISAYGMISIDAQDIGPFTPNTLYVIAQIDNNIYLVSKPIETELQPLNDCTVLWKNTTSYNEDKTWDNYCDCYKREIKKDTQFLDLKAEINKMLQEIDN